jgi:hypothetical protein
MAKTKKVKRVLKQIARLERYLNRERFMPMTCRYRTAVLLSLLSKSLTVGRAVCALVDAGFPAEAFALSRTMIEIFFTIRYITNKDTEKRAERYVKYFARVRVEWKRIIDAHLPKTAEELRKLDPDILMHAEEFESRIHWAEPGVSAKTMATEADTAEMTPAGEGIDSAFDYDALYFWTSHFVHATVEGIRGHSVGGGEVFRVRMRYAEERDLGNNALFNTCIFITKAFVQALRCMNEPQPKALNDLFGAIRRVALNDAARRRRKKKRLVERNVLGGG